MKTLTYFEEFLPDGLLKEAICLSKTAEYDWTNEAKRSLSAQVKLDDGGNFLGSYLAYVQETLNIKILSQSTRFYKRNNDILNPHTDGCFLNFLIYLQGETANVNNGTFFMNKNSEDFAVQTSNITNSAVLFDGKLTHGSVQALNSNSTWRYSLNTFIFECQPCHA